jgi:hypothetical protein
LHLFVQVSQSVGNILTDLKDLLVAHNLHPMSRIRCTSTTRYAIFQDTYPSGLQRHVSSRYTGHQLIQ